jgi:predicted NACHT family NTPase
VPAVATGKGASRIAELLRAERHTPLLHRLGEESLYVPGAPGSGKPTFCRWLALLAAGGTLPDHPISAPEEFRETLPDALRARFPLLCRLREWAGREEGLSGKGHWTRAQLEKSLSFWLDYTRPGGLTAAVFREALAEGHCLLILDGWTKCRRPSPAAICPDATSSPA